MITEAQHTEANHNMYVLPVSTTSTNQAGFLSQHIIHSVAIIWNLINLNIKKNRKH